MISKIFFMSNVNQSVDEALASTGFIRADRSTNTDKNICICEIFTDVFEHLLQKSQFKIR